MFWTIIAPEVVILLAMRQWRGAQILAEKYRAYGWTKTHGHFLQMGGFTFFEGEHPKHVILIGNLEKLYNDGHVEIPK